MLPLLSLQDNMQFFSVHKGKNSGDSVSIQPIIKLDQDHVAINIPSNLVYWNITIGWGFPHWNNPENHDLSYKLDLNFKDCFGSEKTVL